MTRLMIFLILAISLNVAVGMTFRHKRQSNDDDENNLDDRYGWDRPSGDRPRRPWSRPNQWSNQGGNQWPNQGGNQGPNQGGNQLPNQGGNQWPNQGGNQWPNQGGNQGNQPNQGGNQQPNQGGNQGNQPQTTPATTGTGSSTTLSSEVQDCIRNCPVTPEYNPVCGTNQVQYNNPGRLVCARSCGVDVSQQRVGACATVAATAS